MRVTQTIQNRIFLENLVQTKTRLDKAQAEIATGKKVNELEDDPYAAAQASDISAVSTVNEEFMSNNDHLKVNLNSWTRCSSNSYELWTKPGSWLHAPCLAPQTRKVDLLWQLVSMV